MGRPAGTLPGKSLRLGFGLAPRLWFALSRFQQILRFFLWRRRKRSVGQNLFRRRCCLGQQPGLLDEAHGSGPLANQKNENRRLRPATAIRGWVSLSISSAGEVSGAVTGVDCA